MDGPQEERRVVQLLREHDYPAIRLAASGGGAQYELPDVYFVCGDYHVGAEMKASSDDYAYITDQEMEELRTFCREFDAVPIAVSRWSQDTDYYVQPLHDLDETMLTDSGNLSLRRDQRGRYFELLRYCEILERS